MTAGYISAECYRALQPKKIISELSFADCFNYSYPICEELKVLFENDKIIENLYYLEKIEAELEYPNNDALIILNTCLEDVNSRVLDFITSVGKERFLRDYLFCTDECLENLNHINDKNLYAITKLRYDVSIRYKKLNEGLPTSPILENIFIDSEETSVVEKKSQELIPEETPLINLSGIDDDSLSGETQWAKKYVLFLNSLGWPELKNLKLGLDVILSSCSVRTRNCIEIIGTKSFFVNYLFAEDKKLYEIRKLGRKSVEELSSVKPLIYNLVIDLYNSSDTEVFDNVVKDEERKNSLSLRERLGDIQYQLLFKELLVLKNNASVRAQNGINNFHGDFIEHFVVQSHDIRELRNIGKKTEEELNNIISTLRKFIETLPDAHELSDEEIFIRDKRYDYGDLIDDFCIQFYKEKSSFPILHILQNGINSLINKSNVKIYNQVYPLFQGNVGKTIETVAKDNELTRERVRQILSKVYDKFFAGKDNDKNPYNVYQNILLHSEDWQYLLDSIDHKDLYFASDLQIQLHEEQCTLVPDFVFHVFYIVFQDKFDYIEPIANSSSERIWGQPFLVSKDLNEHFNFSVLPEIIDSFEKNNISSISLTTQELVLDTFYSAWNTFDFSISDRLSFVVSQLLIEGLGYIPNYDFSFTFEGRKQISPEDAIFDLLSSQGHPIDINTLFDSIRSLLSLKSKTPNVIKKIVSNDPRMSLVGKDNMVTLTEWEHIKIGNIRELIIEYLDSFDEPQHIKNIVEHITEHRDTTENSIRSTMGSGSQFQAFAGGYWGLADRQYSEWYYLSESERTALDRVVEFEQFVNETGHLPFSPTDNKHEEILYQWWKRVNRTATMAVTVKEKIDRIKTLFANVPKNRSDLLWFEKYNEYKAYIIENGRKPGKGSTKEKELDAWYRKNFEDISNGKLSSNKESAFINLVALV